jgi:hypothetical protein
MTESISAPTLARPAGDLRVRGVRALRGRNLWSPDPVVAGEVIMEDLAAGAPADAEGFIDRLGETLPGAQRLADGASWPDAVLHAAMELQRCW